MSDYPLFIPEFMLYTKSSLLWFKITTKLREFRNYLSDFKISSYRYFRLTIYRYMIYFNYNISRDDICVKLNFIGC